MSLRRSARISTTSLAPTPESKPANGVAKPEPKNSAPAPRKRKSRASAGATPSSSNANDAYWTTDSNGDAPAKASEPAFAIPELPSTPVSKRRIAAPNTPTPAPPFTPTPSGVGLITSTSDSHYLKDEKGYKPRPADAHATNAPLSTPGGSRLVAYASSPIKAPDADDNASQAENGNENNENASPSKKPRKAKEVVPPDVGALPHPTLTIDTLLKEACEHLCSVDPKLKRLIDGHHCKMFSPEGLREVVDPFTALASGIIGQQVSGAAASSIRAKFTALFPTSHPSFPSPSQVIELDIPTLRTAGLSQRKAEYIHGLASKFASGELSAQMLISASDDELIEKLVAVRGLGRWSVEMFACFGLKRMDVFSTGDLGVQ
ncbi:DNA glycosylase [Clohesyomyces aquaticus]|uniref:DNA glycosylase n=1 Tax=Clohesyomyces aquaticus TaxID=1231657 RepID=A0A1Y1ZGI7_9PLEO|nr:DNA glycosylase [Clohesyomyces aquaticus]